MGSGTLWKIKLFLWHSLSSNSLTMSTAIEYEESDTTLYGWIEDNVVVVSLMFFCNSFPNEQRFSILGENQKLLYICSHILESEISFCLWISMLMTLSNHR